MNFGGKVAVVTGAGAGIGRETAIQFAAHGAAVAALDINEPAVEQTARTIVDQGGKCLPIRADVSAEVDVAKAFKHVGETLGPVTILANIAGVELYKDFVDFQPSEWDSQIAVNLRSVYLCSRAAIPFMMRSGGGCIVNTASVQALATTGQVSAYAAAKAGILGLTRDMARDLGSHNIRVNGICPGCIDTPMMDRSLARVPDRESVVRQMAGAIPLRRLGTSDDIAHVILFLASSYAAYITGAAIVIDGGLMTRLPLPGFAEA